MNGLVHISTVAVCHKELAVKECTSVEDIVEVGHTPVNGYV